MWRGGATAASAARALRSRMFPDSIHHPAAALAPIASARSSSSAPSAAAGPTVAEATADAVAVSQRAGSVLDVLRHYGRCYFELSKVFEIKNDAKMKRTMRRPLPSGRISPAHAAIWATSAGAAGTALLACKANGLAAGLAASNLILYAFVYTPLKQIHPVNTWVGAVVGAIPPLLGYSS
ncbi:hypothetical protein E2562_005908 [Oryza meyeriana var. granulata]|uniref:Heme O synthase n=1 Tax=Oryza meyeriana var. granulata TaxID=110450 RepID=A0A6G1DTZ1_9ORYZ|nr:hypothetical protein E2562_005908 [Oryza meyeriana var. granulata]